jgi:carboxyl-terminal processing protease
MPRAVLFRWSVFLLAVIGSVIGLLNLTIASHGNEANHNLSHSRHHQKRHMAETRHESRRSNPAIPQGQWRSRGYGWLWSVEGGGVTTYDESGELCIKNSRQDLDPLAAIIKVTPDGRSLSVERLHDDYVYTFDRVDALPSSCRSTASVDARAVVEVAIAILGKHYPFFQARSIDWLRVAETARRQVSAKTTDRELFRILRQLLSHFPDSHVRLVASVNGKRMTYDPSDEPSYSDRVSPESDSVINRRVVWNSALFKKWLKTSRRTVANGRISFGLVGDVGYLKISAMEGYSIAAADRAMVKAMKRFADAKAVIVDVSSNAGGYDAIARRIASYFAPRKTIGYFKYPGDSHEPPQPMFIQRSEYGTYLGPVYLVTSRDTISAAEVFVLAMRALPNVTHIGETTDGSLSDELTKKLPNGWYLTLSNEIYLDDQGVAWEGRGIVPKFEIAVQNDEALSFVQVRALRGLLDKIKSEHGIIGVLFN